MDSDALIKIYESEIEFEKTCIKNNISLFNFRYLEFSKNSNINESVKYPYLYITLWINNELIAVLKQVTFNGFKFNNFVLDSTRTICYITVNLNYQNQGYSKKIVEAYFSLLNNNNIHDKIFISPFSKNGWFYLKNNLEILAEKYNIELNKNNYCYE